MGDTESKRHFNTWPGSVYLTGRYPLITADKSIIATDSRTADVHIEGLSDVGFITNYEALELTTVPSSLVVIGAGYVGVDMLRQFINLLIEEGNMSLESLANRG